MEDQKLEITDENFDGYDNLYFIKTNSAFILARNTKEKVLFYGLSILMYTGTFILSLRMASFLMDINGLFGIFIGSSMVIGGCALISKLLSISNQKFQIKKLKEEYPDIDINIDKEELKKALVKYKELSKVEKDFDKKKEEHLENYQESFRSMAPSEKIAFLEKEKQFWEQEAILEKYQTSELDIHKKIGEKKI